MKREAVLALNERQWITPLPEEDADFQCCIVPGEAALLASLFVGDSARGAKELCTKAFVDFRGYENGNGQPVPNSLAARMELFRVLSVRRAVVDALTESNEEFARGEGSGGSD